MIGTFGEKALSVLPYPVITLMSMIQFKGGFLKRLDAIMLAVWFFTLFALLSLNLYYGSLLLRGAIDQENKKKRRTGADAEPRGAVGEKRENATKPTSVVGGNRENTTKPTGVVDENRGTTTKPTGITGVHITVLAAAFLAGLVIGNREDAWQLFISFFLYIQIPLYLLLPGLFAIAVEKPAIESECSKDQAKESRFAENPAKESGCGETPARETGCAKESAKECGCGKESAKENRCRENPARKTGYGEEASHRGPEKERE
jgi:hypothetical protein